MHSPEPAFPPADEPSVPPTPESPFHALAELSPDAILVNSGGHIAYANRAAATLFGVDAPDDLIGYSPFDLIEPQYHDAVRQRIRHVVEDGLATPPLDERWQRLDGTTVDVEVAAGPIRWDGGAAVQVVVRDVSERRRGQAALRLSQERLAAALATAHMAAWEWDSATDLVITSESAADVLGLLPGERLDNAMAGLRLIHPGDVKRQRALARRVAEGEDWHAEFRIVRPRDGRIAWLEVRSVTTRSPDTGGVRSAGLIWDITERKHAEAALRESELRFRTIAELVPDLLWSNEPGGAARWCNGSWLEYTGQTLEEALSYGWLSSIHPDDRDRSLRNFQQAVAARAPLREEHRVRRADGVYRWFLVQIRPVHDEEGHITQWLGAATDVHEERLAQEAEQAAHRQAEEARQAAERESSAQKRFLAMLSHDVRVPLGAIVGFAELLGSEVMGPLSPKQREFASRIQASAGQIVAIIDDILAFSRAGPGRAEIRIDLVDLAGIAREVVETLAADAGSRAPNLLLRVPDAPYRVLTDGGKVRQIAVNLVSNALRYAEHGTVEVELEPGEGVFELRVRDAGPGIPADRLEDIFEPFVQLDPSDPRSRRGSGLGLAICRRLARLLGGDVTVESVKGQGSTFTLRLPEQPVPATGVSA